MKKINKTLMEKGNEKTQKHKNINCKIKKH